MKRHRLDQHDSARSVSRAMLLLIVITSALVIGPLAALAQETDSDEADLLRLGAETYTNQCSECHQAGGVGQSGIYPPLLGNPQVQDTDYLIDTIQNGREGEIVVNGETFNDVMRPLTLTDTEIEGLVAYIQGGFVAPPPAADAETGTKLPVATGALPTLSGMAMYVAFALAALLGLWVLAPKIISPTNRLNLPWMDAWLRGAVIAGFFIVATVFIPSRVLQTETVGRLPREVQDVLGAGLWFGALAIGLGALWWAHRENRI